jgi:hypothetical protein
VSQAAGGGGGGELGRKEGERGARLGRKERERERERERFPLFIFSYLALNFTSKLLLTNHSITSKKIMVRHDATTKEIPPLGFINT